MHNSLKLLCLTVFVLMGMPRLNIKIGSLPIYAIDVLLLATYYQAMQLRPSFRGEIPFAGSVMAILGIAVLSELSTLMSYGVVAQPVYMMIRTLLAVSLFFSVSRIVQTPGHVQAVFKAGLLGLIITSLMMILSSLGPTRSIANIFFSYSFLEPASKSTFRAFSFYEDARRGRSLVGVSILSGAFINTFWPFVSMLYRWPGLVGRWKQLALLGTVLAPFAVVMSYSRGAILGLFFVVGGLLFFGSGRNNRGIIIAVLLSLTVFNTVGWRSNYFFFDRVEERVQAMIENPYEDPRETERIYAYTQPFEHVFEHPAFLFIGDGLSATKISAAKGGARMGQAYHALFAGAYYAYGMVAAFIYVFLVMKAFSFLWGQLQKPAPMGSFPVLYAQVLFAGLLGMLPWLLFGHAAVSTPRGAMLFFFLFGMIASLKNFQGPRKRLARKV